MVKTIIDSSRGITTEAIGNGLIIKTNVIFHQNLGIKNGFSITNLLSLGTNSDIAVGDVIYVDSGEGLVVCDTVTTSSSTWFAAAAETRSFAGDSISVNRRFVDFTGVTEQGAASAMTAQLRLGFTFRLEEVFHVTANATNSFIVSVHKNGNLTPEDSNTFDPSGSLVPVTTVFDMDFVATDALSIGTSSSLSPGNIRGHVVVRRLFQ